MAAMTAPADGPVASLSWVPTRPKGGASFCTHRLREEGRVLRFEPIRGTKTFVLAFLAAGMAAEVGGVALFFAPVPIWMPIIALAVGGLFTGAAVFMRARVLTPRIFDLGAGTFRSAAGETPLGQVRKLQLLTHTVEQRSRPGEGPAAYDCHELNLVLEGNRRVHVVAHGDLGQLRGDAQVLAERLGVELLHREK